MKFLVKFLSPQMVKRKLFTLMRRRGLMLLWAIKRRFFVGNISYRYVNRINVSVEY